MPVLHFSNFPPTETSFLAGSDFRNWLIITTKNHFALLCLVSPFETHDSVRRYWVSNQNKYQLIWLYSAYFVLSCASQYEMKPTLLQSKVSYALHRFLYHRTDGWLGRMPRRIHCERNARKNHQHHLGVISIIIIIIIINSHYAILFRSRHPTMPMLCSLALVVIVFPVVCLLLHTSIDRRRRLSRSRSSSITTLLQHFFSVIE